MDVSLLDRKADMNDNDLLASSHVEEENDGETRGGRERATVFLFVSLSGEPPALEATGLEEYGGR